MAISVNVIITFCIVQTSRIVREKAKNKKRNPDITAHETFQTTNLLCIRLKAIIRRTFDKNFILLMLFEMFPEEEM